MKSILLPAALLVAGALVGACASSPQDPAGGSQEHSELVYRTGSNIAVRERVSKEDKDKRAEDSQRALQQMQTTGAGKPKID